MKKRLKKKLLTNPDKIFYNSSKTYKHCGRTIAFWDDAGACYVHCRKCGEWVKLNNIEEA